MRVAPVLVVVLLSVSPLGQARDPVTPYLAPRYTASPDAPSTMIIAGPDEPGERLVVTGRTLAGTTPVAGVSIYAFQTDASGRYAPGLPNGGQAELNPRLHGALRTDAQGRYRYETIRPGFYNGPRHVHHVVIAPGFVPRLVDLRFQDDPMLAARRQAAIPKWKPKRSSCRRARFNRTAWLSAR
ncbi:MAG: hypothetical protein AB7I25_05790 [Vicinamibacterales bacterium]